MEFEDMVKKRDLNSHKGDYGRVLSVCGSYGMAGAAILCGKACLHCGVGLLDIALEEKVYPIVASNVYEAIYTIYHDETELLISINKANTIVMGCGLSLKPISLVKYVLNHTTVPIILDADALNIIALENIDLNRLERTIIITPHLKEMARLINTSVEYVQKNAQVVAVEYAKKNNVIVVLKTHNTIVANPVGALYFNNTGNPGMATGGSGDVLAGMIAAFVANNADIYRAVCAAVYFHGLAGDLAAKKLSMTSMLPSDMIDSLPIIFKKIENKK